MAHVADRLSSERLPDQCSGHPYNEEAYDRPRGACCDRQTRARFGQEEIVNGAPGRIRTYDLKLRRLVLYPTELRARTRFN